MSLYRIARAERLLDRLGAPVLSADAAAAIPQRRMVDGYVIIGYGDVKISIPDNGRESEGWPARVRHRP